MSDTPDLASFQREYEDKKRSFTTFKGNQTEVAFTPGARFYRDGKGDVMFAYKSSAVSEFVSKATDEQKAAWPKEWAAFRGLKPRKE